MQNSSSFQTVFCALLHRKAGLSRPFLPENHLHTRSHFLKSVALRNRWKFIICFSF